MFAYDLVDVSTFRRGALLRSTERFESPARTSIAHYAHRRRGCDGSIATISAHLWIQFARRDNLRRSFLLLAPLGLFAFISSRPRLGRERCREEVRLLGWRVRVRRLLWRYRPLSCAFVYPCALFARRCARRISSPPFGGIFFARVPFGASLLLGLALLLARFPVVTFPLLPRLALVRERQSRQHGDAARRIVDGCAKCARQTDARDVDTDRRAERRGGTVEQVLASSSTRDERRGGEHARGDVRGATRTSTCATRDEHERGDGGAGESASERNDEDVRSVVLLGVAVYDQGARGCVRVVLLVSRTG